MSTTPPRQRRRDRVADVYSPGAASDNDAPGTPGPTRARINNLEGQVQELVRKLHAVERKAAAEAKEHQHKMEEVNNKEAWARFQLEDATAKLTRMEQKVSGFAVNMDIERTMAEGYIKLKESEAALAAADEALQRLGTERTTKATQSDLLMRDHQLLLLQSQQADVLAETRGKDKRIAQLEEALESANTSLAHQRAAEDKARALISSQGEARAEVSALEAKITELEKTNKSLREKEKEARRELEQALSDETGEAGSSDREVGELRSQLRAVKKEVREHSQKAEEAKEALEEYKERMDAKYARLKEKAKALQVENERLAEVESELTDLRATKSAEPEPKATKAKKVVAAPSASPTPSPVKPKAKSKPAPKPRSRKTSPNESDDEAPKKKPKAEKKPLRETSADNIKSAAASPAKDPVPADKKKKRRILGGAAPAAFTWDPIMNSGDGVIPTFLSPVRPGGKSVGTVPRAGFGSLASRGRKD